ncbi:protein-glutamate methylesterase/protein-glutamine glutaminase [Formivibrio citricus]|uniref:protein-glutamate methylesterase/protein-glutamine glutaminase n=1 Tax=Formivibrio citricus TaxID=83765 RepID=UPI002481EF49|nr:chemotaxis response regulator protein-glutamate methylesterase [Formivibrio citricus]
MPIKVLVVDDSAVVRQVIQEVLSVESDIQVMGAAPDPIFAMERMKKEWPDVIILDIEMPRMDGITFLKQIMAQRPTPVIICSSLAEAGAKVSIEALAAGALSIITKPSIGLRGFLQDASLDLVQSVRTAAKARVSRPTAATGVMAERSVTPKLTADVMLEAPSAGRSALVHATERVIAMGVSTGGTQALEVILPNLPLNVPGMVIVQHMPEKFTAAFAARLNGLSTIEVKEAQNGDRVMAGRALIAPGGKHMMLKRNANNYYVEVADGPLVSRHRPSVDVLFRSAAKFAGANAVGIIMTGMGDDGAKGLKEMHDCGAKTYAQDEDSSVVFGMPKEAIKLGGVDHIVPLHRIPDIITKA